MSKFSDLIAEATLLTWDEQADEEYRINPPAWLKDLVTFAYKTGQMSVSKPRDVEG